MEYAIGFRECGATKMRWGLFAVFHNWLSVVEMIRISVGQLATIICGNLKLTANGYDSMSWCLIQIYTGALCMALHECVLRTIDDASTFSWLTSQGGRKLSRTFARTTVGVDASVVLALFSPCRTLCVTTHLRVLSRKRIYTYVNEWRGL